MANVGVSLARPPSPQGTGIVLMLRISRATEGRPCEFEEITQK